MNIRKKLLVMMILCSLFVISIPSSIAVDETLTDSQDDVIFTDETGTETITDQKPNIDIVEATYTKNGIQATVTIKVKGEIEDKGSDTEMSGVIYYATLDTSDASCTIFYMNKICTVTVNDGEPENITPDISADKHALSVSFNLSSTSETYASLYIETTDVDITDMTTGFMYSDTAPNQPLNVIAKGEPQEAKVSENINFTGNAIFGTPPYTWSWDFGDGSTSTKQSVIHKYNTEGTYNVTLTVTDSADTSETDTITVTVSPGQSPNGGGGSSNANLIIFVVIIVIVAIIGLVVVVFIIRR